MTELEKLDSALDEIGIAHEMVEQPHDGKKMLIAYGGRTGLKYLFDVICNEFSYGGKFGLLEVMGKWLVGDKDAHGWLTAENVMDLVKKKLKKREWLNLHILHKKSHNRIKSHCSTLSTCGILYPVKNEREANSTLRFPIGNSRKPIRHVPDKNVGNFYAAVVQLAEHRISNPSVAGSIPVSCSTCVMQAMN